MISWLLALLASSQVPYELLALVLSMPSSKVWHSFRRNVPCCGKIIAFLLFTPPLKVSGGISFGVKISGGICSGSKVSFWQTPRFFDSIPLAKVSGV